ncbi:MAG: hypothetical protein NT093_04865 [Candidatus Moranbacteria bacterium]|nr:hypothetical protein [Candidatus Moranbacteria bacterium]
MKIQSLALAVLLAVLACGCNVYSLETKQMRMPLRSSMQESAFGSVSMAIASGYRWQSVSMSATWEKGNSSSHPEMKSDEILWTNCTVDQFGSIPFQTKRAGKVAYYADDREIGGSGGSRYVPVFVKSWEWEAVRKMAAKEKKYPFHFWSRNTFFANAKVTLIGVEGCSSLGKKREVTFRLKPERSLGKSWEYQVIIPQNFHVLEIIVKPKGKKAIKFLLAQEEIKEGGRVNLLLSSCPLPEMFARPRVSISQDSKTARRFWSAMFRAPVNIPVGYR